MVSSSERPLREAPEPDSERTFVNNAINAPYPASAGDSSQSAEV